MAGRVVANAVFEGGGVKGIGLAGAVAEMEDAGYRWSHLAGTSAGAVVAGLLAAGYRGEEMGKLLEEVDFRRFLDSGGLPPPVALVLRWGLYRGRVFEGWVRELLAARGVRRFGDLADPQAPDRRLCHRLQVIASDLTLRRMLVLPRDASRYGLHPDRMDVARAIRMSASLPLLYEPTRLGRRGQASLVVDGGLLSNFPIWLLDGTGLPTIGFLLVEPSHGRPSRIRGPVSLMLALVGTMLEAHDRRHLEERDFARTVAIPTLGVGTVEFDLGRERRRQLYQAGRLAARRFLETWDFEAYQRRFGPGRPRTGGMPEESEKWGR